MKLGDIVKVTHHSEDDGIWCEEMEKCIGKIGVVTELDSESREYIEVYFDEWDESWNFNPPELSLVGLDEDHPIASLLAWQKFEGINKSTYLKLVRMPRYTMASIDMDEIESYMNRVFKFDSFCLSPVGVNITMPGVCTFSVPKSCLEICEPDIEILTLEEEYRYDEDEWDDDDELNSPF